MELVGGWESSALGSSSLLDNFDCLWLYRLEKLYNVGVEGVVLGEAGGCSCCAAHYQL